MQRTIFLSTAMLCLTLLIAIWLHGRQNRYESGPVAASDNARWVFDHQTGKTYMAIHEQIGNSGSRTLWLYLGKPEGTDAGDLTTHPITTVTPPK